MDEAEIHDIVITVSTEELIERLAAYGVTRKNLAYDCRHGYLPHPNTDIHDSGRGRAGRYDASVVPRAKRLYRLRKAHCEPRTIRLLLFLRDGWGWEYIRGDCIEGARTVLGQSLNGLKRYAPKGTLDDFAVDNIIAHQHDALLRKLGKPTPNLKPTSQQTTRFFLGVFGTGQPIEGASSKRVMAPIARAFWPGIGRFQTWALCKAFDVLVILMDLRSERMTERIANASDQQTERGRKSYLHHLRLVRFVMRRMSRPVPKGTSFSLITLGGHAAKIDQKDFAKSGMSMYQMLAASIGIFIAIEIAFEEFVECWRPMLPSLMKAVLSKPGPARD